MENKKHIEWIDFARSVAIICVVICHATEMVYQLNYQGMHRVGLQSKIFALTSFTIGRTGVPIFMFITGYLLLHRQYDDQGCLKFWKNNLLPLIITTEVWIIINNLFLAFYDGRHLKMGVLIRNMFFMEKMEFGHFWYMPMVIGIYIFIPFIATVLNKFSLKILSFPITVTILYTFGIKSADIFLEAKGYKTLSNILNLNFGGLEFGVYFIIGYLFYKGYFAKISKNIFRAGALLLFVITVALQVYMYINYEGFSLWYNFIFLLIYSTCLWGVFTRIENVRFYGAFKLIAKYSFGIYLVHYPVLILLKKYFILRMAMPFKVVILTAVSFAVSFLLVYAASKAPKIGKVLFLVK